MIQPLEEQPAGTMLQPRWRWKSLTQGAFAHPVLPKKSMRPSGARFSTLGAALALAAAMMIAVKMVVNCILKDLEVVFALGESNMMLSRKSGL